MSSTPLLEARGISRRRPTTSEEWLLEDIWLSIEAGRRLALVGPTGAGKTILLRALAVLDPIDAGEVFWSGQAVPDADVPEFRRRVVYLHQRPVLIEGTVEDNLRLPFRFASSTSPYDRSQVQRMLSTLGREAPFLDRTTRNLSGGEAQIVALLRALQLDPAVLLLDEPTAALDSETVASIETLVERWFREGVSTRATLWVSHDAAQAMRVADQTVRLQDGRLI